MPKLINLLLIIIGIIATGTGIARMHDHPGTWPVLVAGLLVLALAAYSDTLRARRVTRRKQADTEKRVEEIKQHPLMPGTTFRVPGSPWLMPCALLLVALGAAALYLDLQAAGHDWRLLASGGFLLAIGLLVFARIVGGIGRPALEITTTGIVTPLYGKISWQDISGIFLRTITSRGGSKHFVLQFRVKDLARSAEHIHWTDRLFAPLRSSALAKGVVSVPLPAAKEYQEAVYAAARQQWKLATGNDYDWNPLMSDQYNEALQRAHQLTERLNHPLPTEPSLSDLQKLEADMMQASRDTTLMRDELKRRKSTYNRVLGAFVVLALLLFAARVVLALLPA